MTESVKVVSLTPPPKPDAPSKFAVGSAVQLNGGFVIMTVRKAGRAVIECDWHNEVGDLLSGTFPPAMLVPADLDIEIDFEDGNDGVQH